MAKPNDPNQPLIEHTFDALWSIRDEVACPAHRAQSDMHVLHVRAKAGSQC